MSQASIPDVSLVLAVRTTVRFLLLTHGYKVELDHTLQSLGNAKILHEKEGGNWLVIELTLLLLSLSELEAAKSERYVTSILGSLETSPDLVEAIKETVRMVNNFDKITSPPTLEAQIVRDAKRLDELGAIGLVRALERNLRQGTCFYQPGSKSRSTGYEYLYRNLSVLPAGMHTQTARHIALERETFLRSFLARYVQERNLQPDAKTNVDDI